MSKVYFKGQEVTNPVKKALAVVLGLGVALLTLVIVLPLVGIIVTASVGFALAVVAIVLLAVPFIVFGSSVFAIVLAPLKFFKDDTLMNMITLGTKKALNTKKVRIYCEAF